ncbi:MAG: SPFH domain-containing protein, partial [Gaiellaceae bacterium]
MSNEHQATVWSGWPMLAVTIALSALAPTFFILSSVEATRDAAGNSQPVLWMILVGIAFVLLAILASAGFFTLQPNEARVLILFGRYKGTTRQVGFLWGNPFFSNGRAAAGKPRLFKSGRADEGGTQSARRLPRYKVSLRARTLNGERLKVNDRAGNPVDIAAVVVWHVQNTAQAIFDVDDF